MGGRVRRKLNALGWSVLRLWEYEIVRDPGKCAQRVAARPARRSPAPARIR